MVSKKVKNCREMTVLFQDKQTNSYYIDPYVMVGITHCETWKLTKQAENSPRIAQRAMERAMLGITLRDRKKSTWI